MERNGAQKRRKFWNEWQPLFGKNLPTFRNLSVHRPRGETRRTDSVGVKYQGEARGRGGGKARDGSGHGKRYRPSWNRGNEPDIDRVDRAYSPRLYVRLFAEK